jgi:hypothetical protein
MTTKLTLSVEKQTITDIKLLAKEQGTSVSAMFERFARSVTRDSRPQPKIGPLTRRATGLLKLPRNKTARHVLEEALLERYGLS